MGHLLRNCISILDERFQNEHTKGVIEVSHVSLESTKRGPPTNKNISVTNIKAQITNMLTNESAGFKSEYHVRTGNQILYMYI